MQDRKRYIASIGLLVFLLLCIGTATAVLFRPGIEEELRREIIVRGVHGRDLGGVRIPPDQIEVFSAVKYPFVVEASYFVPVDMHGRYHRVVFIVMPWGRYQLSTHDVFPL